VQLPHSDSFASQTPEVAARHAESIAATVRQHYRMKVKFLFILLFIASEFMSAQVLDTIHGRIISSVTKEVPDGVIYIMEKGTSNGTLADSSGIFKLVPIKDKKEYILEISVGAYETLTYHYKSEWTERSRPKSIILSADCKMLESHFNTSENKGLKLYIIGGIAPVANTKFDRRFEKKYKIRYYDFGCEPIVYECIEKNNERVFEVLDRLHGNKWRKEVRNDVVGYKR